MSKEQYWSDVSVALMNLAQAFNECNKAFDNVDEGELNNIISDNYPFDMSFDELTLEVIHWSRDCRKTIANKQS